VLHTHAFDGAHATPYLVIRSAVKRGGKTRLEEVLGLLVRGPWRIAAASESALFRKISAERPALLLDEVDAIWGARAEGTEPIRAILNAGNRPGVAVSRVVGEGANLRPVDFSVYCPKILAGIITARWPDTVLDRSIIIDLQRKKPGEKVDRFRYRKGRAATEQLRVELARWAAEHVDVLRDAEVELPAGLDDRAAESWEPLFAIADLAQRESGDGWGAIAWRAAIRLASARVEDDAHGILALIAIRAIFGEHEALHSSAIVEQLNHDEQLPFGDYRKGDGLNSRGLAKLLNPFAIKPHPVRVAGKQARGYHNDQFADAWARYCETPRPDDSEASQRHTPSNDGGFSHFSIRHTEPDVTETETLENPDGDWVRDAVTDRNASHRGETEDRTQNEPLDPEKQAAIEKLAADYFADKERGS
jgi:hypothetical protein